MRELRLLKAGDTDTITAARNVILDAAGVSIGGWAGSIAGAYIGDYFGPIGNVIGGVIGSVLGAIAGRGITDKIKQANYRAAVECYAEILSTAQSIIKEKEQELCTEFLLTIDKEHAVTQENARIIQSDFKQKVRACLKVYETESYIFINQFRQRFRYTLNKIRDSLYEQQKKQPTKTTRSIFSIWKARIKIIERKFFALENQLISVRPPVAAKAFAQFLANNHLQNAELDHAYCELYSITKASIERYNSLIKSAKILCSIKYISSLVRIQKHRIAIIQKTVHIITTQKETVNAAKNLMIMEGRRIGIDLVALMQE